MSVFSRLVAHFSALSMAVPARLALWMGLFCVAIGHQTREPAFTIVGVSLIVVGTGLWLWFRPTGGGWRQLVGLRPKVGQKRSGEGRQASANAKVPAKSERVKAAEALAAMRQAAQNDPRLQAKRKPGENP